MPAFIITYDITGGNQHPHHNDILDTLKSFPNGQELSANAFAITTTLNPSKVRDRFKKFLTAADTLLVLPLASASWSGKAGNEATNQWLTNAVGRYQRTYKTVPIALLRKKGKTYLPKAIKRPSAKTSAAA